MIRVYDFDFNLLAETKRCLSSEWELKYNGIGTYEGCYSINTDIASIFAEHKYLIITEDDRQAVCIGKHISDNLRVYGRTPEWLFSKRVVLPFKTSEIFGDCYTDPETLILYLLSNTYKTPYIVGEDGVISSEINKKAICENIILPEKVGAESLNRHFWRNSAKPLSEVIIDLCDIMGCGFSLKADFAAKCWRFNLEFGREQNLIISKSLKNAYDMTLKESVQDATEGGYFEIFDSDKGENTYGYIYKESQESGILYWEKVLASASGQSEAEKLLKKAEEEYKLNCELLGVSYGKDYNMGDVLRVQFEAGSFRKTLKRRVVGVSIISSPKERSIKPSFAEI
ncbi:MAG: hypothetical protein KIG65_00425 [Eubacteriales bacterium]|nr:hypothetical protein [Eubacteriales bacterium]